MSLYNNSAFGPPYKNMQRMGNNPWPVYLFGKFDTKTEPFKLQVTHAALTGNVATLTVQIVGGGGPTAGLLPSVGAKMGARGVALNAAFNADPAIVTGVNIDPATGTGTITYAVTHADIAGADTPGEAAVQPFETPDTLTQGVASMPVALTSTPDESDNSRCVFAECTFPSVPDAATIELQTANVDDDARYVTVTDPTGAAIIVATVAGGIVTKSGQQFPFVMGKFLRLYPSAVSGGTLPSIVGTITA